MGFGINFSMTAVVAMAVVSRKAVGGAAPSGVCLAPCC
jgi:hypothetical protein